MEVLLKKLSLIKKVMFIHYNFKGFDPIKKIKTMSKRSTIDIKSFIIDGHSNEIEMMVII
jgi:hypothetical protein